MVWQQLLSFWHQVVLYSWFASTTWQRSPVTKAVVPAITFYVAWMQGCRFWESTDSNVQAALALPLQVASGCFCCCFFLSDCSCGALTAAEACPWCCFSCCHFCIGCQAITAAEELRQLLLQQVPQRMLVLTAIANSFAELLVANSKQMHSPGCKLWTPCS